MQRNSLFSFLLEGFANWCYENGHIPDILVNCVHRGVDVPKEHVKKGFITLGLGSNGVRNLVFRAEHLEFMARFNGVARHIVVPYSAVCQVVARGLETGMHNPEYVHVGEDDKENPLHVAYVNPPIVSNPLSEVGRAIEEIMSSEPTSGNEQGELKFEKKEVKRPTLTVVK